MTFLSILGLGAVAFAVISLASVLGLGKGNSPFRPKRKNEWDFERDSRNKELEEELWESHEVIADLEGRLAELEDYQYEQNIRHSVEREHLKKKYDNARFNYRLVRFGISSASTLAIGLMTGDLTGKGLIAGLIVYFLTDVFANDGERG